MPWLIGTALFMYCWNEISKQTNWDYVWDAPSIAADIGGRSVPPKWSYI